MSAPPLKILLTDPHLRGGGQVRYLSNLTRELVRMGHDVTLGCRPGSVLIDVAQDSGCKVVSTFPFRGGLRPAAWSGDLLNIHRYVREQNPDIIHVNLSQDHWSCGVANRFMGHPVCLIRTRHNTYTVNDTFVNGVLNRKWTDYQIVVCETVRSTLASQPTFDESRLRSIHNGVDAELYNADLEARHRAREEFGYTSDDIVLGIAARLVSAKGHEFLFRTVASLIESAPDVKVLALGEGELEEPLKELVHDLDIERQVTFAGYRDDMPYCTQAFDIGVQPSIDCDTSSFSLKEQMAAHKPVVASDHGGLTEIVEDGVEGFVVPQGTVEPLAEALLKLVQDAELRKSMGEAGRRRVLREFTVEVFAEKTVEAYRTALELHRQRKSA